MGSVTQRNKLSQAGLDAHTVVVAGTRCPQACAFDLLSHKKFSNIVSLSFVSMSLIFIQALGVP